VEILDACDVLVLLSTPGRARVTGVRVLPQADGAAKSII
jgi:hypothetical protein